MASVTQDIPRIDQNLVERLDAIEDADQLIDELLNLFDDRAAIGTSGQLTGCVLIDLAARRGHPFRVFVIDTLRLHPETYAFWDRLEEHYSIKLERFKPDEEKLERMLNQHGEFLFFDSKFKQEHCCNVRKVEPNQRAMQSLDVWITGLRRDQSAERGDTPRVSIGQEGVRDILKVCPLVDWDEERVRNYISEHDVPYNPLFDVSLHGAHYKSLGCIICTTPVMPHEPPRAGRWRWFNAVEEGKKECGLHI
jgi:phosphoadenosine phosphosulfate reductase